MSATPRKQLQAFYKAQGLTGKHARKAVTHDLRLARRNFKAKPVLFVRSWQARCRLGIGSLFVWSETAQGHGYWRERAEALPC